MPDSDAHRAERRRQVLVLSLVPGLVLALILASWALAHWQIGPVFVNAALALCAVLLGGLPRFVSAVKDALRARITTNVFVTVALGVTVAVGEFRAAAIIVFIMSVVGALESYTLDKSRRAIRDLLRLAPPTATVRRDGAEVTVLAAELRAGDIVVVRPGERIPVDGTVISGASNRQPGADHRRVDPGREVQGERSVRRDSQRDRAARCAYGEDRRRHDARPDRAPRRGGAGDQGTHPDLGRPFHRVVPPLGARAGHYRISHLRRHQGGRGHPAGRMPVRVFHRDPECGDRRHRQHGAPGGPHQRRDLL